MRVVNLKNERYTHYIGRGNILGNPFIIGQDGTRKDVIRKYEEYARKRLFKDIDFTEVLYNLPDDAVLGCFCKPLACHGDIIMKLRKELDNEKV